MLVQVGGRWSIVVAPGEEDRLPPLSRPGAEKSALHRKRQREAELAAVSAAPHSTFALQHIIGGAVAAERERPLRSSAARRAAFHAGSLLRKPAG